EGRSSLKTWLYGIVANKAKALAAREGRLLPRSWDDEAGAGEGPSLPRSRFTFLGTWAEPPAPWARGDGPEGALLRGELRRELARQLETLPEGQRLVVLLRDVEGYTSEEVRDLLGIGDVNQRVLLHRGRSKLRGALEAYVRGHALPPTPPSGPPFPLFTTAASAMPITCPSLIELATDYREGALPGWQRTRISLHLLRCRHCRSYVRQLDETSELLRELDDPPAPAGAERAALLERLRPAKASGR
ncbi:MAG TPA: sigma factor-like helix-turn-helix DNA-binding protein, partial [Polyangiaceae bacterium]|nr:sigma factor-like helix-turn-helix DNA-binding protein [Polyangiaceae bacterium]